MTAPIDRAAEAPRILGVEMTHGDYGWELKLGPFTFELFRGMGDMNCARAILGSCYRTIRNGSQIDCIAAIERELLAIRDAIPTRPACASCGGRHTSTTDEETCFEAHAAIPAQKQDESDNWRWCMPGIPPESKP